MRVLGGAEVCVALGKLGTLVGEAGVRTVCVVPQVGIVGVVSPGVTVPYKSKIIN